MSFDLSTHSDHPPRTVAVVSATVVRDTTDLRLAFTVTPPDAVLFPTPATPARADGLWRTTCFELFVALDGDRYLEFNFSPSTRWAAYSFDGYRTGMTPLPLVDPPRVERRADGVAATLRAGDLPATARIAFCAVIEETDGAKSYWALAHPPGPPDFHHPACFTATLPPPDRR